MREKYLGGAWPAGQRMATMNAALGFARGTVGDSEVDKAGRIAENIDVFDFELAAQETTPIDGLDTGRRDGPEPAAVTLEAYGRDIPEA